MQWLEGEFDINKPAATRPDASDNSMTEATSMGQYTVQEGTFWGVLNVLLCASGTQLPLDLTCFVIRYFFVTHRGSLLTF